MVQNFPDVNTEEFLKAHSFNEKSIEFFVKIKGYKTLNFLQHQYVEKYINNDKIVIIAPTSSGKTTVALLKVVKILQESEIKRRFIYLLPYSQLLKEKLSELSMLKFFELKVTQDIDEYQKGEANFLVCSFHEMDAYFRFHLTLDEPDIFIFDELDVVESTFFGPVVESVIANLQILGILKKVISITATVGNMQLLSKWLDTSTIFEVKNYRPVPLKRMVEYRPKGLTPEALIDIYKNMANIKGHPILVIRFNKPFVAALAKHLAGLLPPREIDIELLKEKYEATSFIRDIFFMLQHGVGIYHADVPSTIQDFVIINYNNEKLPFLIASPSLARGVNLKCRTVVIDPNLVMGTIKRSDYEQISGRAGRLGLQSEGYSIIFAKDESQKRRFEEKYITGELESLGSGFFEGEKFRLEIFELEILKTIFTIPCDIDKLFNRFSCYYFVCGMEQQHKTDFLNTHIHSALNELQKLELIELGRSAYITSDYGKFYVSNQCYGIPGMNLKQYYKLLHQIINRILNNELEISVSNFYHIIREILNNFEEDEGLFIRFSKSTEIKKKTIDKTIQFIHEKCGLLESSNLRRDLTFVILINYLMGKSLQQIEGDYEVEVSPIHKIIKTIPQIITKAHKFLSEAFSVEEKEDWLTLLSFMRDSIRYGVPIMHVPFRSHLAPKKMPRNIWLEFILRIQMKHKDAPLKSYKDIFDAEKSFKYISGIGEIRNQEITENIDNICHSEERLREFLDRIEISFPFNVDARLPSPGMS